MDAYEIIARTCDYMARDFKAHWYLTGWYLFTDTRPGEPADRVKLDADVYNMMRRAW